MTKTITKILRQHKKANGGQIRVDELFRELRMKFDRKNKPPKHSTMNLLAYDAVAYLDGILCWAIEANPIGGYVVIERPRRGAGKFSRRLPGYFVRKYGRVLLVSHSDAIGSGRKARPSLTPEEEDRLTLLAYCNFSDAMPKRTDGMRAEEWVERIGDTCYRRVRLVPA